MDTRVLDKEHIFANSGDLRRGNSERTTVGSLAASLTPPVENYAPKIKCTSSHKVMSGPVDLGWELKCLPCKHRDLNLIQRTQMK